jgi:Mycobacterium membrane protein
MFRLFKRLWIPLVVIAVVVAGGWTVSRLHGIFGNEKSLSYGDTGKDEAKPIDPKYLKYEVFGPPGTSADISYFDAEGDPQYIEGVQLPWTLEFPITSATGVGSVAAQGDSDSIGCRLLVDTVVKSEKSTYAVSAFTSCLLKAA